MDGRLVVWRQPTCADNSTREDLSVMVKTMYSLCYVSVPYLFKDYCSSELGI